MMERNVLVVKLIRAAIDASVLPVNHQTSITPHAVRGAREEA
jgi:hypothetical protein